MRARHPVTRGDVLPHRARTGRRTSTRRPAARSPSVCPSQGEPHGKFTLPLSRDVVQLTLMSSDFRPTSVSLLMHQRDVPEFITAIISEGHVARILGDERDPGGEGTVGPVAAPQPSPRTAPRRGQWLGRPLGSPSQLPLPTERSPPCPAPCPPNSAVSCVVAVPAGASLQGQSMGLCLQLDASGRSLCCSLPVLGRAGAPWGSRPRSGGHFTFQGSPPPALGPLHGSACDKGPAKSAPFLGMAREGGKVEGARGTVCLPVS